MDQDKIDYIFNYFSHFMTEVESQAWRHEQSRLQLEHAENKDPDFIRKRQAIYYEKGWMTTNPYVLSFLERGTDYFIEEVAKRIAKEHKTEVVYNRCKKCSKLARTPKAQQCKACGYTWFTPEKEVSLEPSLVNEDLTDEQVSYIFTHFKELFTENETKTLQHLHIMETYKEKYISFETTEMYKRYVSTGHISKNPEVLELAKDGLDKFRYKTAQRVYREHPKEVEHNVCEKCLKPTRTPKARQCRFCGHTWFNKS